MTDKLLNNTTALERHIIFLSCRSLVLNSIRSIMNSGAAVLQFLIIAALVFITCMSVPSFCTSEYHYPMGCDQSEGQCSYILSWKRNGPNMDFAWKAKLDKNQGVGVAWTRKFSLANADAVILWVYQKPDKKETYNTAKLVASVIRGTIKGHQILWDTIQSISNISVSYDRISKLAEAAFSRPLRLKNLISFDGDLNRCPSWVFLPVTGSIVPVKDSSSGAATNKIVKKFDMNLKAGTMFHPIKFKC